MWHSRRGGPKCKGWTDWVEGRGAGGSSVVHALACQTSAAALLIDNWHKALMLPSEAVCYSSASLVTEVCAAACNDS